MNNERFAIPETLLHPSDIGIQEMGVAEAIVDSISSLPKGEERFNYLLRYSIQSLYLAWEYISLYVAAFNGKAVIQDNIQV